MKSLQEYRVEEIDRKKKKTYVESEWEEVFKKIQKVLDNYECNIPEIDPFSENFHVDLIKKYIESYLLKDEEYPELWKDLLVYSKSESDIGYKRTRISHSFKVTPKQIRLSQRSGAWVWEHQEEVSSFMTDKTKKYEKLDLIARLFPIHIDY